MREWNIGDLLITYKNQSTVLNASLLKKQGIEDLETVERLCASHVDKFKIFEAMENTDDPKELHDLAIVYEALEFSQQHVWGFPENRDMHRWWVVPKCTCPHVDNENAYGTEYRHINGNCPVHGKL